MRRLPLYVALAVFGLYAGTLGGRLTLAGLPLVSQLAGWNETPMIGQPLLWLLTFPLRALPVDWLPLLLKLLAATLAATILGLLTRSVQLLPWDHPWQNVSRLGRVLPGLTAVAVCGLDFNFWLEATSTCGNLLDLLPLVAAFWLLLEYNHRRQPSWLQAAAVVWGVGLAENWMMLPALPLFLATVIWLERFRLIGWSFLVRLAWLMAAGFSIYVIVPTANGLLPHSPWSFGHAWFMSLQQTWHSVILPLRIWRAHRFAAMAQTVCFLVPTLPLLVRMRDEGGFNKSGLDRFQLWLYRGLRLGVLLACCWLAFDPAPGGRQMMPALAGHLPRLTFDFLNGLAAAFLAGNLLLAGHLVARDEYAFPRGAIQRAWRRLGVPLALAGFAAVVVGLLVRNGPAVGRTNYHPLEQFGAAAVASLPTGRGVVLSDFPDKLMVFEMALARAHRTADWLAVDTVALPKVEYRAGLEHRLPAGWLTEQTRHELTLVETLALLQEVARGNRLFYLHSSHGLYFERFYQEPVGALQELKPRGADPLAVPALSAAGLKANEQFWTRLWDRELMALAPRPRAPGAARLWARFGLTPAPRTQDLVLGELYSIPLDAWGVTLQKSGRLPEARARFEQALLLNSNNLSARFSLDCNTNLQAGRRLGLGDVRKLGTPEQVNQALRNFGPFDEPTLNCFLGAVFFADGYLVQAAEQFERLRTLAPGYQDAELALPRIYIGMRMPERSRAMAAVLRAEFLTGRSTNSVPPASLDLALAIEECRSWLLQTNPASARDALQAVVKRHPDEPQIATSVAGAFLDLNDPADAGPLIDGRLATAPEDVQALNIKAIVLIRSEHAAEAIPYLDHALALTNDPVLRLNRAMAHIASRNFGPARSDLADLQQRGFATGPVTYQLALLAEHDADTNAAVHYLQLCLSNSPAGGPLWQTAQAHWRQLTAPPAPK
jgi:tetratricopeptide (TPR) repeat protein